MQANIKLKLLCLWRKHSRR